jgi:hypothetical protein
MVYQWLFTNLDNEKLSSINELLLSDGILCDRIQKTEYFITWTNSNFTHIHDDFNAEINEKMFD